MLKPKKPKEQKILKPYTVLSIAVDNGQILCDHVMASSHLTAYTAVVKQREGESLDFVAAVDGHLSEDHGIGFPGECTVSTETVEDQPDVFGDD